MDISEDDHGEIDLLMQLYTLLNYVPLSHITFFDFAKSFTQIVIASRSTFYSIYTPKDMQVDECDLRAPNYCVGACYV